MRAAGLVVVALLGGGRLTAQVAGHVPIARFFDAVSSERRISDAALEEIRNGWRAGYAALVVDLVRATWPRGAPSAQDQGALGRQRLLRFLERQTGQRFADDMDRWHTWVWSLPYEPHPDYPALKRALYGVIDPRMRAFFPDGVKSEIRLDQIDWGGVKVNGIPPLGSPKVVPASAAAYLKDSNVVFGIVANGEARAYPKRILAWHEMALDRLGGIDLTIVYCTLCGTVMPFDSVAAGRRFRFGTSGLLYQSNKLMFDEDTSSLWSTFEGKPVVGSLVGSGISLRTRPVVTTTWKAWRTEHPETSVLSLETGYQRDYAEGAAYRDYFASETLMFPVSRTDQRLRNKDEVLVMRLPAGTGQPAPVAIAVRFLRAHAVYPFTVGQAQYVAITSPSGANRVYQVEGVFPEQPHGPVVVDTTGRRWQVTEEALIPEGAGVGPGPRMPAQRAFWFGWFAQFPDTVLIK